MWVLSLYASPLIFLLPFISYPEQTYWLDIVFYYFVYSLLTVWIIAVAQYTRLGRTEFLGKVPNIGDVRSFAVVFFAVWIISAAINFLTFYPLALVVPEFVSLWLFELPSVVYVDSDGPIVIPNLLNLIVLIVLAPVIEEVIFRGYLLHRWGRKYGLKKGVILSSLLFGLSHPDVLAAFFFGVVMCGVYLRTQSLYGAIILHASWNGLTYVWVLAEKSIFGWDYHPTLEQYMDSWIYGVASVVASGVIISIYVYRSKSTRIWHLPNS